MLPPAPQAKRTITAIHYRDIRMKKINVKLLRRLSSYLLLLSLLSAVVLAQKPVQRATPSADRLREIVTYLASDKLEGRRTGSPGANEAAHYIAAEFQRLGLSDPDENPPPVSANTEQMIARYRQPFPYVAGVELGNNNLFYVNHRRADDTAQ